MTFPSKEIVNMLLTPLQELNAVYLGRFIALAEISPFTDPHATVVSLVQLVREYQKKDGELLKQLRAGK
jgi:hypothetical protein